jgi:hypothetical protein
VLGSDPVDELHDDDRLADSRAAEKADLSASGKRLDQVDDLDPCLEHFGFRALVLETRGLTGEWGSAR